MCHPFLIFSAFQQLSYDKCHISTVLMYTPSLVSALCTPSRHLFYWFPIFSQNACQQHQDKGHEPAACSHGLRSGNNSRAQGFSVQKLQIQHVAESMEDNVFLPPLQRISSHMVVKCQYKMLRIPHSNGVIWKCDPFLWCVRAVKRFLSSLVVAAVETCQDICIWPVIHRYEKKKHTTTPQDAC